MPKHPAIGSGYGGESHSLWMDVPPLFTETLAANRAADVCVVGAGISGLTTAYVLAKAGKDVEKIVLARALKTVFQDRVFICGNKTVIF